MFIFDGFLISNIKYLDRYFSMSCCCSMAATQLIMAVYLKLLSIIVVVVFCSLLQYQLLNDERKKSKKDEHMAKSTRRSPKTLRNWVEYYSTVQLGWSQRYNIWPFQSSRNVLYGAIAQTKLTGGRLTDISTVAAVAQAESQKTQPPPGCSSPRWPTSSFYHRSPLLLALTIKC